MDSSGQCRVREALRRFLAAGCIALVFALGVFAACPNLHEQLHRHDAASVDDGCAVVLFAGGVSVPLAMPVVQPAAEEWRAQPFFGSAEVWVDSPHYRLQPGRGPPVG